MILYGVGGHSKVVIDCLIAQDDNVFGIFDDRSDLVSLNGYDVLGPYSAEERSEDKVIITIEDNLTRKRTVPNIKHSFGKAIHPSAEVSGYAKVGEGTVIVHGTIVQTGAKIGKHTILNTSCVVDHDSSIGHFSHISPNVTICDNVEIGEGVHIGAGATILPGVQIGKWCVIGAGAVITQNLPDYSLVVGVPGKIIRKLDK
jgi:sugar O-acyltransferase (sialic acid O-acetyltransferase NeuD family)